MRSCFWLLLVFQLTVAKHVRTSLLKDRTQWTFVDKFCFDASGGRVTVTARLTPNHPHPHSILFYHDIPETGWLSVANSGVSCRLKGSRAAANITVVDNVLSQTYPVLGARPRWWYVVVANCNGEQIAVEEIDIVFTNNGDRWTKHFSKDEEGVFECIVFMLIALLLLGILCGLAFWKFSREVHQGKWLMGLLWIVVGLHWLSVVFQANHRDVYSYDGIGYPELDRFCEFFEMVPHLILVFLFIGLAKGFVLNPSEFKKSIRALGEVLFLYLVCTIAIFWWAIDSFDPANNVFIFQNPAGLILVLVRVVVLLWFLVSVYHVHGGQSANVRRFYTYLTVVAIFWFLALPVVIIVAFAMQDYNRHRSVKIMQLLCDLASYVLLFAVLIKGAQLKVFINQGVSVPSSEEYEQPPVYKDAPTQDPEDVPLQKVVATKDEENDDDKESSSDSSDDNDESTV